MKDIMKIKRAWAIKDGDNFVIVYQSPKGKLRQYVTPDFADFVATFQATTEYGSEPTIDKSCTYKYFSSLADVTHAAETKQVFAYFEYNGTDQWGRQHGSYEFYNDDGGYFLNAFGPLTKLSDTYNAHSYQRDGYHGFTNIWDGHR